MIKFILLLTTYSLLLTVIAFAAVSSSADDATVIGGGARPLGMGRAFTAVADDVDAPFINSAGSAGLKGPSAMAMFTNLLGGEVYYSEYCAAVPAKFGTVGIGYISTGVNSIPTTNEAGVIVPSDYYDNLLLFTYSTPLARFFGYGRNVFVGLNYKIFNRGLSGGFNQFASGQSLDFGLKLIVSPYLNLALSRQNILPVSLGGVLRYSSGAEESFSGLTKIGLASKPLPFNGRLLLAFDADLPSQSTRPTTFHVGAEYKVMRALTVRGGLDQSADTSSPSKTSWNPAFGLSLDFSGFRVDYAYHPYYNDPSLATSFISLSYVGEPWLALKGGPSPLPATLDRRGR